MNMKITGGILKDQKIKDDKRQASLFLLVDSLREEIFNFISKENIIHKKVLDLSANNGVLGIEALSRGAEICDFVEKDPDLSQLIRDNLSVCGLLSSGRVYTLTEEEFLKKVLVKYNLIFYNSVDKPLYLYLIEKILGHLALDGRLVLIYTYRIILPLKIKETKLIQTTQIGELKISIYEKNSK